MFARQRLWCFSSETNPRQKSASVLETKASFIYSCNQLELEAVFIVNLLRRWTIEIAFSPVKCVDWTDIAQVYIYPVNRLWLEESDRGWKKPRRNWLRVEWRGGMGWFFFSLSLPFILRKRACWQASVYNHSGPHLGPHSWPYMKGTSQYSSLLVISRYITNNLFKVNNSSKSVVSYYIT